MPHAGIWLQLFNGFNANTTRLICRQFQIIHIAKELFTCSVFLSLPLEPKSHSMWTNVALRSDGAREWVTCIHTRVCCCRDDGFMSFQNTSW